MFKNIYFRRLLVSLRDKGSFIWTLFFPLVLSTVFFVTFGSLDTVGQLRSFPVGLVEDENYRQDAAFKAALESVSGQDGLFELSVYADPVQADAALENGEIEGYIIAGEVPTLVVSQDGINQTIAKSFLDRYIQTKNSLETILSQNPGAATDLLPLITQVDFTEEISLSKNPPTNKNVYFYALLAMVCMYGGFEGLLSVTYLQANLSSLGARRTMSPAPRWKLIVYDLLGGITIQTLTLVTLVFYIIFVLGRNFGEQLWAVLLTCLVGSMLGVSFGTMVSAVTKFKQKIKVAILISVTMVCSYLAGLMTSGINYLIAENAPVIAWLNPAARITDAFYCLYYYDNYERYFLNIGVITGMAVVMFLVAAIFVRRQRYESV